MKSAREFIKANGGSPERSQQELKKIITETKTIGEALQAIYEAEMSESEKIAAAFVFGAWNTQNAVSEIFGIPLTVLHNILTLFHTSEE